MKKNDYINAILHAFAHVSPLRDYFLLNEPKSHFSEIVVRFGNLIRKMWNLKAFKGQVSPHELIQVTRSYRVQQLNRLGSIKS